VRGGAEPRRAHKPKKKSDALVLGKNEYTRSSKGSAGVVQNYSEEEKKPKGKPKRSQKRVSRFEEDLP